MLDERGFAVRVLGSQNDFAAGDYIARNSPAVNLCGQTTLEDAVDLTDLQATLTPFSSFNVGTVLVQGGVVIAVLLAFNRRLARPFENEDEA